MDNRNDELDLNQPVNNVHGDAHGNARGNAHGADAVVEPDAIILPDAIIQNERLDPVNAVNHVAQFVPPELDPPMRDAVRDAIRPPIEAIVREGNQVIEAFAEQNEELAFEVDEHAANLEILHGQLDVAEARNLAGQADPHRVVPIEPYVAGVRTDDIPLQAVPVPADIVERGDHMRHVLAHGLRPTVNLGRLSGPFHPGRARRIVQYLNSALEYVNRQLMTATANVDQFIRENTGLERQARGRDQLIDVLRLRAEEANARAHQAEDRNRQLVAAREAVIEDVEVVAQAPHVELVPAAAVLREAMHGARIDDVAATDGAMVLVVGVQRTWAGHTCALECLWSTQSTSSMPLRPQGMRVHVDVGGVHRYTGIGPVMKVLLRRGIGEATVGLRGLSHGAGFRLFFVSHAGCVVPMPKSAHVRGLVLSDMVVPLDQIRFGSPIYPMVETHVTACIELGLTPQAAVRLGRSMALGVPQDVDAGPAPSRSDTRRDTRIAPRHASTTSHGRLRPSLAVVSTTPMAVTPMTATPMASLRVADRAAKSDTPTTSVTLSIVVMGMAMSAGLMLVVRTLWARARMR